ncbi:MAG: hypothetical protein ACREE9_03855 [Stellaceae bacterium]
MNATKMPGFTAESAISKTAARYRMARVSLAYPAQIQPAMRNTCDVLAELLWAAYLGRSYTAAQFFYDAMDGAGCFR